MWTGVLAVYCVTQLEEQNQNYVALYNANQFFKLLLLMEFKLFTVNYNEVKEIVTISQLIND